MENNLKALRKERGISISELARRAALSRVTISNIENGLSNPTMTTMVAISKVLGRAPNDIFFTQFVNHELQGGK